MIDMINFHLFPNIFEGKREKGKQVKARDWPQLDCTVGLIIFWAALLFTNFVKI